MLLTSSRSRLSCSAGSCRTRLHYIYLHFSRYLLGCQALRSTSCIDAKPVFRRLFQEWGMPERIRTDNGVPFATVSLARLSTLSAWFVRLGIMPELIEPGEPQQNGRHERIHRTLKAEATRPPAANSRTQQRTFNRFRKELTMSDHTRRSSWRLRLQLIGHLLVPILRNCPRSNIQPTSKLVMSVTMAASAGSRLGST